MSADTTTAIVKFKGEYYVSVVQAAENLLDPKYMWGHLIGYSWESFDTLGEAEGYAFELEKDDYGTEYGVQSFDCDRVQMCEVGAARRIEGTIDLLKDGPQSERVLQLQTLLYVCKWLADFNFRSNE